MAEFNIKGHGHVDLIANMLVLKIRDGLEQILSKRRVVRIIDNNGNVFHNCSLVQGLNML
jgi:hypothetical protein